MLAACSAQPAPDSPPDLDTGTPSATMSWIHVAHSPGRRPYFADQWGREVQLHGTNVTGVYRNHEEEDNHPGVTPKTQDVAAYTGACPVNDARWANPPLCQVDAGGGPWSSAAFDSRNDLSQMRALGFDVVRLAINWEEVEPTPGHYDQAFVARVGQVVDWAEEQGIYVLVDFHQDHYGDIPRTDVANPPLTTRPGGQAEGAPRWAVLSEGQPNVYPLGFDVASPAAARAFQRFWENAVPPVPQGEAPGTGLQDHYLGAVAAVMAPLRDRAAVVGVELMNEPQPGETDPVSMAANLLYPFYTRAVEALTGERDGRPTCPSAAPSSMNGQCAYPDLLSDRRHLVFFEPDAIRNLFDVSIQPNQRFSDYPNLVFAPHVYTHLFTVDSTLAHTPADQSTFPPSYDFAYQTADIEARAMDTALLVTEFGGSEGDAAQQTEGTLAAQERSLTGGTVWEWKYNCGPDPSCGGGPGPDGANEASRWSMYQSGGGGPHPPQNGPIQPLRARHLTRIYPRLTSGTLRSAAFDPATGSFTMTATASTPVTPGDEHRETLVVIPPGLGGVPTTTGAAVLDRVVDNPDGSRWVWVAPTGGAYGVDVG